MTDHNPLSKQAAKASWIIPLFALGVAEFANTLFKSNPAASTTISMIVPVLLVLGFGFGVFALFGIKKYGKKLILVPSIVGICLSSGFLALIVSIAVSTFQKHAG